MTTPSVDLPTLQRWMQAVIQHPGGVAAGVRQPSAQAALPLDSDALPQVIAPSSRQTSTQRLQIYADAYFARLLEVLTNEFPALQHAVGPELFAGFAVGYLQAHPSTSYTLSNLGSRFPDYLAATRPQRESVAADWSDFLIDCCRLERTYAEVFDGPGPERATSPATDFLIGMTAEQFVEARLQIAPWVRLIALQFPVHDYVSAVRTGQSPEIPDAAPTWLVVTRRDYRVRRIAVSEAEFIVLAELQRGASVGAALHALANSNPADEPTAGEIERWFRAWTVAGYVRGIELTTGQKIR